MRGSGWKKVVVIAAFILVLSSVVLLGPPALESKSSDASKVSGSVNPLATEMVQQVGEDNIYSSVNDLQKFTTRYYGTPGNQMAATYIFNRLSNISGLSVEYQNGEYRNVVATLPGRDTSSSSFFLVGAHYDSTSKGDKNNAPGATDDGGGVAIVLEMARIMSHYSFNHTIKFALWNDEEADMKGSGAFVHDAVATGQNISAYMNFDSSCYDPDHHLVLDIMSNDQSKWLSEVMTQNNDDYGLGLNLTYNVHNCNSDHVPFWNNGYTAVMTHSETHGPAHTQSDTVDKISTNYAKKNGQLGMATLATVAEIV